MNNIRKFEDFLDKMQGLIDNAKKQGHIIVPIEDIENTFPELKESEDEKIRKEMLAFLQETIDTVGDSPNIWTLRNAKKWLAWLKEQSEDDADKDIRYTYLEELLIADNIWQMAVNDAMVEDARTKAIAALSKLGIIKLLGLEKQVVQKSNMYDAPKISIKDAVEVTSRMKYIPNDMKSIADFIIDYAHWDLQKSEWNQPTITVPLFRVLDALIQNGKPYCVGNSALEAIKEEKVDNANKVEHKFNVGEWLCENEPNNYARFIQILAIVNVQGKERYRISRDIHNDEDVVEFDFVEKYYHKFDIKDAKDGDVLYLQKDGKEHIIIYKGVIKERFRTFVSAYCAYNGIVDAFCFADVSRYADIAYGGIMPATKEQRDTLMKAMAGAGYEWDDKEKKPIKIEASFPSFDEQQGTPVIAYNKEHCQNAAWSEEDEDNLTDTCVAIRKFYHRNNGAQDLIDWLKSLKERETWKPSDKQIRALRWVLNNIPYNTHKEEISGLLDQIKDL